MKILGILLVMLTMLAVVVIGASRNGIKIGIMEILLFALFILSTGISSLINGGLGIAVYIIWILVLFGKSRKTSSS